MIYIVKKHEPRELTEYRESESSTGVRPTYDSMSSDLHEYVLSKLVEEQGGLCAYCMCRIPETDKKTGSTLKCTIEHIEPQSLTRGTENLKKELEYSNFLAVCSGNENRGALCCDKSRGNKKLFLTPLNPECNHLIQYSLSGKIQAAETIPDKEDRKELDYRPNDSLPFERTVWRAEVPRWNYRHGQRRTRWSHRLPGSMDYCPSLLWPFAQACRQTYTEKKSG